MIKKGDFVKIDYVGRVKATGRVFDLTDEKVAKKEGIYSENDVYEPHAVVIGAGHLLKGLDNALTGSNAGDKKKVDVPASEGFGPRNLELVKVFPKNKFKDQDVPMIPGARVQIGGLPGTISSVSGGRVRVDFNHPLAGKDLTYDVKVLGKVTKTDEQVLSIVSLYYGQGDFKTVVNGEIAEISVPTDVKAEWAVAKNRIVHDILEYTKAKKVRFIEEYDKKSEIGGKEKNK